MKLERAILIAFIGNYLINNVVAAIVALIPASTSGSMFTPQYISYVILAAVFAGLFTWWYLREVRGNDTLRSGAIFGVIAFVVSILTAFVTGVAGVMAQTGSVSQMIKIIPNFGPFLASWSTLVLLGYWVIPAALVGWMLQRGMAARTTVPVQTM